MTLARIVDGVITDRVLVFGSLPPGGRDLDLLVRSFEEQAIASLLTEQGFLRRNHQWLRFGSCTVESVDLIPASTWALPPGQVEALFAEAKDIDGFSLLVRPAPHHLLLILARRIVQGGGQLDGKRLRRVEGALHEDPAAWDQAAELAPSWGARKALALLEWTYRTRMPIAASRRFAALREDPRRKRSAVQSSLRPLVSFRRRAGSGCVITLSGLDGSGKTSQAEALRDTLHALDVDAVVVWARLTRNPSLNLVAKPLKKLIVVVKGTSLRSRDALKALAPSEDIGKDFRRQSAALTHLWATVVALANGITQRRTTRYHLRRGRIVIRDRYTLDSVSHLRYRYGLPGPLPFQARIIGLISPKPALSYFLDVAPEVALSRKAERYDQLQLARLAELYREEHSVLGVRRLNGERSRHELCETIAREVWEELQRRRT